MHPSRQSQQLARQLCQLSIEDGAVSAQRVGAVLAFLRERPPRQPLAVLKHYRRLVARELARSQAIVEHAGAIDARILAAIETAMSRRYRRTIAMVPRSNPQLIAGLRIRVGDDIYESSVASQLAALTISD
jgi:F-type H+-transporting ATPase subunit delta